MDGDGVTGMTHIMTLLRLEVNHTCIEVVIVTRDSKIKVLDTASVGTHVHEYNKLLELPVKVCNVPYITLTHKNNTDVAIDSVMPRHHLSAH